MELGQKLKLARQEAGLSQRQLVDGCITRNMLSQIENGSARPSMDTLALLASRLGKPVSYFLDEQAVVSPNQTCMTEARTALAEGRHGDAVRILADYRKGDTTFDQEYALALFLGYIGMARQAVQEARFPYALSLLDKADALQSIYLTADMRRRSHILRAQAGGSWLLAPEDDVLLLRAQHAQSPADCLAILAAVSSITPLWHTLQADALFALGRYEQAASHYEKAPQTRTVLEQLELCWRNLGDYKKAYEYACAQRAENWK